MAGTNYAVLADQIASRTAQQYGLDPAYFKSIFHAQINQESGFNPNAKSGAGAEGIAQIMPQYHPGVDPMNPQAALAYAAKWDAQNFKKYGNAQDVLSVYNSGRPWAKGRGIAETNNYVKSILGAAKVGGGAKVGTGSVPSRANGPGYGVDTSGGMANQRAALIQSLLSMAGPKPAPQTTAPAPGGVFNPMASGPNASSLMGNLVNAAWGTPGGYKPPIGKPPPPGLIGTSGTGKPSKGLTIVPGGFSTRPGIQLNAGVAKPAETLARQFNVKINSGYRSPSHNASVGGAKNSDHLSGNAVDYTGTPAAMKALYNYALKAGYAYVEPWSQTGGSHVHISFSRGGVKA